MNQLHVYEIWDLVTVFLQLRRVKKTMLQLESMHRSLLIINLGIISIEKQLQLFRDCLNYLSAFMDIIVSANVSFLYCWHDLL